MNENVLVKGADFSLQAPAHNNNQKLGQVKERKLSDTDFFIFIQRGNISQQSASHCIIINQCFDPPAETFNCCQHFVGETVSSL